jgi:hypothetical protein
MTTGDAHWATDIKVWFVLIKDSKGRYKNNPLWGDGWGWALFKQVATDYKKLSTNTRLLSRGMQSGRAESRCYP